MSSSASSTRAHQGSAPRSASSMNNSIPPSNQDLLSSQRIAAYRATSVQAQPPCRMHHVVEDVDQAAMDRTQKQLDELEEMMSQYGRAHTCFVPTNSESKLTSRRRWHPVSHIARVSTTLYFGQRLDPYRKSNFGIIHQPEIRPISQEQLVVQVKGIYARLVMVESKCIEVDRRSSRSHQTRSRHKIEERAMASIHRIASDAVA